MKTQVTFSKGSIDPFEYVWLAGFVAGRGVRNVLEFGPGMSTHLFLGAGCRVLAVETDPDWYRVMAREFATPIKQGRMALHKIDNDPNIEDVMLGLVVSDPVLADPELRRNVDLAFVDAPRASRASDPKWARWNTVSAAMQASSLVLLHDAFRERELSILNALQEDGWKTTIHNVVDPDRSGSSRKARGLAVCERQS